MAATDQTWLSLDFNGLPKIRLCLLGKRNRQLYARLYGDLTEPASSVRGPDSPLSSDLALDKPRPIPSPRQIHPLYGEKAGLLGYCDPLGNAENFPPAPNIVVEGGRIEFVRPSQDGTTTSRRNTMSRGSQTFNDESEKSDPAKVSPLFRFPSVVQLASVSFFFFPPAPPFFSFSFSRDCVCLDTVVYTPRSSRGRTRPTELTTSTTKVWFSTYEYNRHFSAIEIRLVRYPSTLKILEPNVHNAGARIATGAYCTSLVTAILCEANLPPLEIRRKQLSLPYAASKHSTLSNPVYNIITTNTLPEDFTKKPNLPKCFLGIHDESNRMIDYMVSLCLSQPHDSNRAFYDC
ncbi:uncharacterized protein LOC122531693 [Frieseomelitta varia]|uniref:uncharacterized protein LOC122531693 n=1 Tax=Frieseomelitta varia TaxID=561572 RepID=UPI001CB69FD7|nr:uncharacterized protein LOC122531693 [Frieseomelitta varia]